MEKYSVLLINTNFLKVVYIKEDLAIVRILAISDVPVSQYIEGVLRKKNMREFEVDKLKVDHAFLPGDIIKARVVRYCYGSIRSEVYCIAFTGRFQKNFPNNLSR